MSRSACSLRPALQLANRAASLGSVAAEMTSTPNCNSPGRPCASKWTASYGRLVKAASLIACATAPMPSCSRPTSNRSMSRPAACCCRKSVIKLAASATRTSITASSCSGCVAVVSAAARWGTTDGPTPSVATVGANAGAGAGASDWTRTVAISPAMATGAGSAEYKILDSSASTVGCLRADLSMTTVLGGAGRPSRQIRPLVFGRLLAVASRAEH